MGGHGERASGACVLVIVALCQASLGRAQTFPSPPFPSPTPLDTEAVEPGPDAEAVEPDEAAPAADDPALTAGGALALFMASRDYRSLRQLKSVMTPAMWTYYTSHSAVFNGRRGTRLAAFDFSDRDLRSLSPRGAEPTVYQATVRSLWEDQGEAVERRTETVRIARQDSGLWRVGRLEQSGSETLRFTDPNNGLVTLRMFMRAWHRRDLAGGRSHLSPGMLRRFEGREDLLRDMLVGAQDPRHAAYQVLDFVPQEPHGAIARVRLFETSPGRPTPLQSVDRTIRLTRSGARWLIDGWE